MRYREPFTLYARMMKDGRKVWYYRTYDEYGQRTTGRSTGKTSKTLARRLCMELYRVRVGSLRRDRLHTQ